MDLKRGEKKAVGAALAEKFRPKKRGGP